MNRWQTGLLAVSVLLSLAAAVTGIHDATGNRGFLGMESAGVFGESPERTGVLGQSDTGVGVTGVSNRTGINGETNFTESAAVGPAVFGGVRGRHNASGNTGYLGTPSAGLLATSNANAGVVGRSNTGNGVFARSESEAAVYAASKFVGVSSFAPKVAVNGEAIERHGMGLRGVGGDNGTGVRGQTTSGIGAAMDMPATLEETWSSAGRSTNRRARSASIIRSIPRTNTSRTHSSSRRT